MTQRDDGHDYRDSKNKAMAYQKKRFDVALAGLNNQINKLIKLTPTDEEVKLDIEGMETVALFGMKNLLENIRPIWHIGYHPTVEEKYEHYPGFVPVQEGGFDFDKFRDELDYAVFCYKSGRYVATFSDFGEYLCIPKERITT